MSKFQGAFSGRQQDPLEWSARQKIAVGAARGLRYLHEECRVGCIVHRDMRPNNILITHDFEPLVRIFPILDNFQKISMKLGMFLHSLGLLELMNFIFYFFLNISSRQCLSSILFL